MDCKIHTPRHLVFSAQGNKTDSQADTQGLEDLEAHHAIPQNVEGFEAAPE